MTDDENKLNIDLSAMIPRVTEEVAAKLRESAFDNLKYQVTQACALEIKKYIEENIVPSVRAEMVKHEAEMKAAIIGGILASMSDLTARIHADAVKKIAGYDGEKLVADIVGKLFSRY